MEDNEPPRNHQHNVITPEQDKDVIIKRLEQERDALLEHLELAMMELASIYTEPLQVTPPPQSKLKQFVANLLITTNRTTQMFEEMLIMFSKIAKWLSNLFKKALFCINQEVDEREPINSNAANGQTGSGNGAANDNTDPGTNQQDPQNTDGVDPNKLQDPHQHNPENMPLPEDLQKDVELMDDGKIKVRNDSQDRSIIPNPPLDGSGPVNTCLPLYEAQKQQASLMEGSNSQSPQSKSKSKSKPKSDSASNDSKHHSGNSLHEKRHKKSHKRRHRA